MVICQRQKMMQRLHEAWGKLVSTRINKGQLEFFLLSHSMTQKSRRTRKCLLSTLLSESKWVSESHSVLSDSLQPHGLYRLWYSPGQNTGVGSLSLFQGIFPTQGPNPDLPHCRRILYQLNHKGNPRILKWVAYPFSSRSSQTRNWTRVSCIAGRFFLPTELWGKSLLCTRFC